MGAILKYILFCGLVILGVIMGLAADLPTGPVAAAGVWAAAAGAIVAVVGRYLRRRG